MNSPNSACQHSSVIRPSAKQMSWQKIRQVQWKPVCFPAHLPQNRVVATQHLSFAWNILVEICSPGASPASTTDESWPMIAGWDRNTFLVSIVPCTPFPGAEAVQSGLMPSLKYGLVGTSRKKTSILATHKPLWTEVYEVTPGMQTSLCFNFCAS